MMKKTQHIRNLINIRRSYRTKKKLKQQKSKLKLMNSKILLLKLKKIRKMEYSLEIKRKILMPLKTMISLIKSLINMDRMVKKESVLSPKIKLILPHKNVWKNSEISKAKMLQITLRKISRLPGMNKTFMAKTKLTLLKLTPCYKISELGLKII